MDALAVAIGAGISGKNLGRFYAVRASIAFGFFQFFMPCIGWALGASFLTYIAAFDHWVAFALLFAIGVKMIVDGARGQERSAGVNVLSVKALIVVSIATSIDALAIGVTLNTIDDNALLAAISFGVITFAVSFAGFEFGKKLGARFEKSALIFGGLALIGVGVKTLFDHMS
jgi:putative Mn2+ efflux pump MntP